MKISKTRLAAASFGAALTSLYAAPELSAQPVDDVANGPLTFTPDTVPFFPMGYSYDVGVEVGINGATDLMGNADPLFINVQNNSDGDIGYGFGVVNRPFIGTFNGPASFFLLSPGEVFPGYSSIDGNPGNGSLYAIGGDVGTGVHAIGFVTEFGQVGYFRVDLGAGGGDAVFIDGEVALVDGDGNNDFTVTVPTGGGGGGPMVLIGDVNLDGSVGFDDVPLFIDRVLTSTFQAEADIDGDGVVGFDDVVPFIDLILGASEVSFSGSGDDVAIDEEAVKLQLREQLIAAVAEAKGLDAPAPASAGLAALALGAVGLRRRRKAATTA